MLSDQHFSQLSTGITVHYKFPLFDKFDHCATHSFKNLQTHSNKFCLSFDLIVMLCDQYFSQLSTE